MKLAHPTDCSGLLGTDHCPADLQRLAAEQRQHFAGLVADGDVVDAALAAARAFHGGSGQAVAFAAGAQNSIEQPAATVASLRLLQAKAKAESASANKVPPWQVP